MQTNKRLNKILEDIHDFVADNIYPLEKKIRDLPFDERMPEIQKLREKVKLMGLWTPQLPAAHGGPGLSLAEFGHISEALGRSPFGHFIFNCQAPDAGNMEILVEHGTELQYENFFLPLQRGEIRSCFSMTEPGHAGSNPTMMSTTAVKDGDDYVINGHKWFTSSADGAAFAIVMAITNPDAESPYQRASQIIVPMDTPGFNLVRNIPVMGETGSGWMSHAEIRYENCRVPQSHLLGKEGAGFAIAQQRLGPGRIHHCMRWLGICERAFEMMCERAATREIAPGRPLASKQTIQNWIAECRAEINASRLLVLDAAEKIDAVGQNNARVEISTIKFFVANVLQKTLDRAIQVHGALGITEDTLLSAWYRHERGARIYDGPDEVHKSRVAREVLKEMGYRAR